MNTKRKEAEKEFSFSISEKGKIQGAIFYTLPHPDRIVIKHTEVNKGSEGKGIGRKLVLKVIEYARKHQLKVVTVCGFAQGIIEKTPEYHDVL